MSAPDEYDELIRLARQTQEDQPWRDLPYPHDISPDMVRQWINGPVRRFLEHLLATLAVHYVFPEDWPNPAFVLLDHSGPWENGFPTRLRAADGSPGQRFREPLFAAALLTVWSEDKRFEAHRVLHTSRWLQHQIDRWPVQVVWALDEALNGLCSLDFMFVTVPMLRKAGADRETVARLRQHLSQGTDHVEPDRTGGQASPQNTGTEPNWSKPCSKVDAASRIGVSVDSISRYLEDHPNTVNRISRQKWQFDKNQAFFAKLP